MIKKLVSILLFFWVLMPMLITAQNQWVSYSTTIPSKEYDGCKFKFSALVRIETKDTSAKAQLWARVDKPIGRGFFENMSKRPIRDTEWKTYTIEGIIDSISTQIAFGALVYYSGSFFFDNLQLEIETKNEVWKKIYKNDFEDGNVGLSQGIGMGTSGIDSLYKATVLEIDKNKFLSIEAPDELEYYQKKLLIQKEDTNKVITLYKIAGLYLSGNDKSKAIEYFEKGLQLSKKIGFDLGQIRYYTSMHELYSNRTFVDTQKKIKLYTEGYEFSKKINSRTHIAYFASWLSAEYWNQGNFPDGDKYNHIAIKEYEFLKDTFWLSYCYNDLGVQMEDQKNYKSAIKYHQIALRLRMAQNDNREVGQSYLNLSSIYLEMGLIDSAQIYVIKAMDFYIQQGNKAVRYGLPMSNLLLAHVNFKKGEQSEQNNDVAAAKTNFNEALNYFIKSQKLYREKWSALVADRKDIQIGITHFKLKNYTISDSFLNTGLKVYEAKILTNTIEVQKDKRDAYLYLSKIDSIMGNWKDANLHYRQYIAFRDMLSNEDRTKAITKYQMQYEFDIKEAAAIAEQEKKELALQKEIELKALNYEFEKKQAAAKSEREKKQLQYEQQLRQQQIEAAYARKTAEIEMEQQRKEAIAKVEQEKKDALNASALALSQSEVKRKNQERNYFMIGFGLLAALLGFIVYGYFQKQKANILLQQQKEEIDQKSHELEKSLTELKSTQAQLIQSEKMASLGELTAGIAHEIQNPLNFVNNFSEVSKELLGEMKTELDNGHTKDAKELADDVMVNLDKISHHGKRASDIVKGMLEHSRKSTGEKEPTDINALCDEYLRLGYHGLKAKDKDFNATIETHFDPNLPNINIIPQDIGRVILNLINNAFYAVNERSKNGENGYQPTVSVSSGRVGSPSGVGGERGNGEIIQIVIKDNGSGIPAAIKDKIFQPFFTTKPTGQGTGLGLSLSYDIVKAHGGELKVETKEGEGSKFIILLPV